MHPGISSETLDHLHKQYSFNDIIDLNLACNLGQEWLYTQIKAQYKEVYKPNERVVLAYSGEVSIGLLDWLYQLFDHFDISKCFCLLIADIDTSVHPEMSTELIKFNSYIPPANTIQWKLPDTFCSAPFMRIDIGARGEFNCCCKINDVYGNVNDHSLEELFNQPKLQNLRKRFLNGEKPKECSVCWKNEDIGMTSPRDAIRWDINEQFYNITWQKPSKPKNLHLYTSTLCNLKCRICSDFASSKWAFENVSFNTSDVSIRYNDKAWTVSCNHVFDEIFNNIEHVNLIQIMGGEPLLNKTQLEFIQKVANTAYSKNITLKIVTNGTIWLEHFVEVFQQFKLVTFSFSIDDIGNRFDYQRFGSSWKTVQENLSKYTLLRDKLDNILIDTSTTVSVFNVYYLPELLSYLDLANLDYINFDVLKEPSYFAIDNLSKHTANKILKKYAAVKWKEAHLTGVNSIIKILQNVSNECTMPILIEKITEIDKRRDEDFSSSHLEMAKLIGYTK
jgi:sulfatase maturation enzyme AslB (radical SAM superfamily)